MSGLQNVNRLLVYGDLTLVENQQMSDDEIKSSCYYGKHINVMTIERYNKIIKDKLEVCGCCGRSDCVCGKGYGR